MSLISLIFWIATIFVGLFLLAIWLIEYDPDYQQAAATRLPISVVSSHVLLAVSGLAVWIMYLVTDAERLAWVTVAILAAVVSFGVTMAVRWIGVLRSHGPGAHAKRPDESDGPAPLTVPPERHFPPVVVIGHGLLATGTILLVLLTTLGIGGS
jgi:hypothetical protein